MNVTCARRTTLAVATLVACFGVGALLTASGESPKSLSEAIAGADAVVVATVRDVSPRWQDNERGDRLIVSRLLLDVEENLKGAPGNALSIDVEGGTLDGLTLRVSDLPEPRAGHRAVFLLDRTGPSAYAPSLRGHGILSLDGQDVVRGSRVRLEDIRGIARGLTR